MKDNILDYRPPDPVKRRGRFIAFASAAFTFLLVDVLLGVFIAKTMLRYGLTDRLEILQMLGEVVIPLLAAKAVYGYLRAVSKGKHFPRNN